MNDQVYIYGHTFDIEAIRNKYPFSYTKAKKKYIKCKKYTITFDALMAYTYRTKGYKIVLWGGTYKKMNVFVFKKKRLTRNDLPF